MLDNESGLVEITSRVQHGRHLLTPSREVNDLILGVLGRAQALYGVRLHVFVFMSNHFHMLATVFTAQRMSAFTGFVKANVAKELGRLYDWEEHFWGRRYHSASVGDAPEAQIARFMYILENGCKEGLVASPLDWPGVSTTQALYRGSKTLHGTWYDRTSQYRALKRGEHKLFPSTETVHLSPLPFLENESDDEQKRFVVDAVRQIEQKTALRHKVNRTAPAGAMAIRRQKPQERAKKLKRSHAPLFHAATPEEFRKMRNARRAKVLAYRAASERLKRREIDVSFPPGCFPPPHPYIDGRAPPPYLR